MVRINILCSDEPNKITRVGDNLGFFKKVAIDPNNSETYGYAKSPDFRDIPTALDGLIELHRLLYGSGFEEDPGSFLELSESGFVTKAFGTPGMTVMYHINDRHRHRGDGKIGLIGETQIREGDRLRFFKVFGPMSGMDNSYLVFDRSEYVFGGHPILVKAMHKYVMSGMGKEKWSWKPAQSAVVCLMNEQHEIVETRVTNEDGIVTFLDAAPEQYAPGNYYLTVSEYTDPAFGCSLYSTPYAGVIIPG